MKDSVIETGRVADASGGVVGHGRMGDGAVAAANPPAGPAAGPGVFQIRLNEPDERHPRPVAKPPLKPADLVRAVDAECTVQRVFTFDPATKAYVADAPLPDCSAYTVP